MQQYESTGLDMYTLRNHKNEHINLLQVGRHQNGPNAFYSHYRNMYIIHVVKSGIVSIETGGHRYTLTENDAYLVRPNELTTQTADPKKPCELYFFAFNGGLSEELLSKTAFKNGITFSQLKKPEFYKRLPEIITELEKTSQRTISTYRYLFELLSFFETVEEPISEKTNEDTYYQKYIFSVQEYIQLNYSKSIKISELATKLGLSRSHLFRVFKAAKGMSIEEYLIEVRTRAAKTLLTETQFSCASIASLVGYSHYATFFRIFKQRTGLTPQEYRAQSNRTV